MYCTCNCSLTQCSGASLYIFVHLFDRAIIPDFDECLSGNHSCSLEANCSNTDGGFECTCQEEYFGDGHMCLGDEHSVHVHFA